MDENLQNIEDLFHSALKDNEETPSQNVWEVVDKRLDKDNLISIKRKYTNVKRIAAILLLMLASFALYEINTTHTNDDLAKNNNSDSKNKKILNKINDKGLNEKTTPNTAIVIDTTNTNNKKKEITTPNNSIDTHKNIPNQQPPELADERVLQKQNITEITNSEKDISKNQTSLTVNPKKKITNKAAYKVKIANPTPYEQLLVQNNGGQIYRQFPSLQKQKNKSIEDLQLQLKDLIDTKKLLPSIAVSKIEIFDSGNNALTKSVKRNPGKTSRFSLTPFFSPDIASYHLQNDKVGNQPDNATQIEREEKHEFSSTFGVLVDYKINKHWGLQSGVTLSNINIIVQPKTIYAQPDNTGNIKYRINTSSGYGYILPTFSGNPTIGDSLYAFSSIHSLHYIGIPLAVSYNVTKGKFKFNTQAGASINILTKARIETTVEKGLNNEVDFVNNLQGLKKMYFSGFAGVGIDYGLTKKIALTFSPTVRFALNSINKDATVKSFPMSVGFTTGLKIGL